MMKQRFAVLAASMMLAACAAPAVGHYADVNGLHMYYEDRGHGRPLVLLHGGGSTAETSFGAILPELARTHRVIAPEQQAHGHTADIARPLSFEQMADDTAALLDHLGVHDADIMGFSNGGVVAMQLAIRHPELAHRLVLCSTYYAHAGFPPAFWEGFAHATPAVMPAALRDAYLAAAPHPEQFATSFAKQVALMESFQDLPEAQLRAITVPVLVMVGDADVMSTEHAAQLSRLVAHGELAVMPGSGHGTYLGAREAAKAGSPLPRLAVTMIEAFLDERADH